MFSTDYYTHNPDSKAKHMCQSYSNLTTGCSAPKHQTHWPAYVVSLFTAIINAKQDKKIENSPDHLFFIDFILRLLAVFFFVIRLQGFIDLLLYTIKSAKSFMFQVVVGHPCIVFHFLFCFDTLLLRLIPGSLTPFPSVFSRVHQHQPRPWLFSPVPSYLLFIFPSFPLFVVSLSCPVLMPELCSSAFALLNTCDIHAPVNLL